MCEEHSRTAMLLGEEGLRILRGSRAAVIGLGGVGGSCAEALARAGMGALLLVDMDRVEKSNLNRQAAAMKQTLGLQKTEAMRRRVESVSACAVETKDVFVLPETAREALTGRLDFIVDAVDTVAAKLAIISFAGQSGVPIISCMGMGNRLDPSQIFVCDIYDTEGCALARAVRKGCREAGVQALPVVISREPAMEAAGIEGRKERAPGSAPFVPAAAGLLMASYVVRRLCKLL